MLQHAAALHFGKLVAGVRTEFADGPGVDRIARAQVGEVCADPGLAQSLACSHRHRRDGVGSDPEQWRDVAWRHALHLRVPEDLLPAVRQGVERLGDRLSLDLVERRDLAVRPVLDRVGVVDVGGALAAGPVDRHVADRRRQVGPEPSCRSVALLDGLQDARERLGREVVGFESAGDGSRHGARGRPVALPEHAVGGDVAVAGAEQEVGVAEVVEFTSHKGSGPYGHYGVY